MIPAMDVAKEYSRRLAIREAEVARLAKAHERMIAARAVGDEIYRDEAIVGAAEELL